MNPVKVMTRIFCLYTAFLLSGFAAEFTALRIPDGKVIVDGNDEEWIGGNFDQYTIAALSADRLTYIYKDRGEFSGAADLSASVSLANDSKNFYIFAIVKDDILVNSTSMKTPMKVMILRFSLMDIPLTNCSGRRQWQIRLRIIASSCLSRRKQI